MKHGYPTEVKTQADNTGVNGVYYSSNGFTGGKVWSTRNDWVLLTGEKDGSIITFGFFDHPDNVGYPFHSHARGYGYLLVTIWGLTLIISKMMKLFII